MCFYALTNFIYWEVYKSLLLISTINCNTFAIIIILEIRNRIFLFILLDCVMENKLNTLTKNEIINAFFYLFILINQIFRIIFSF